MIAAPEFIEVLQRIAELERKTDSMFRHGRVHERKYDQEAKRWLVRMQIGGSEQEPFLSPWVPYSQISFGNSRLNVHYVPKVGSQMTLLSPAGDFQQAVAIPMTWWNEHPSPSVKDDEVVLTFGSVKIVMKDKSVVLTIGETEVEITDEKVIHKASKVKTVGKTYLGLDGKDDEPSDLVEVVTDVPSRKTYAKV